VKWPRLPRGPLARLVLVLPFMGLAVAMLWWRGPDWDQVWDAFRIVRWEWVVAAVGLNLLSVVVRALAWHTVISQAIPPPHPRFGLVFSAFCVGLFANAVLPGRVGELARVAVLTHRLQGRQGIWATLVGSVFAHRVFDLFPSMALVTWVLITAKIPGWALTSITAFACVGVILVAIGLLGARRHPGTRIEQGLGPVRRVVTMARYGLGVLRAPLPALVALTCQCLGWLCQLFAVWAAMRAFHIYESLPAAGLVLVLMNIATILPLWPGNVGLLQAAIALPLRQYGVTYARGIAFGFGLQAIEASVGVGIGLIFLAREGLSFAMLRVMPEARQAEVPAAVPPVAAAEQERERARARVSR
jgi:uncharacterized membrane protein YbhN (UPF0104 family)